MSLLDQGSVPVFDKKELAKLKRARKAGKSTATKYTKWNASESGEKFRDRWVKASIHETALKMSSVSQEGNTGETGILGPTGIQG